VNQHTYTIGQTLSILNALNFQEPFKGTLFNHDEEDNVDYKKNYTLLGAVVRKNRQDRSCSSAH